MPKSEKISLKAFWEAVEQKLAKYSTDELRAILCAMAQATPPTQRETFLDKLTPVKGAVVSVQKRLRQDEVLAEIDDLAQEIKEATEEGGGDWEDEYDRGGYYDDEDSLGPYEEFIEPLTALFDRVQVVFEYGNFSLARNAYQKLFEEALQLEDDYGRGVRPDDLTGVDVGESRARYLRAVYETEPPATRPPTLLEQMQQTRMWLSGPLSMLNDLIQISPAPLPDQDRFFADWIARLRKEKGDEADTWLREAIRLSQGTQGLAELAQTEGKKRPRAYLDWFTALEAEGKSRDVFAAAQTALKTLPAKLPIRAAIADHLCAAATRLEEVEALRAGRWEAFSVAPTLPRLLDLWETALHGAARTRLMRQAANHIENYLAHPPRSRGADLLDPWAEDQLESPAWIDRAVFAHACLLAGDLDSAHELAAREKVLGWSSSDNVQGFVVPFCLVLLSGKALNALPSNLKQVWQRGLETSIGVSDWRETDDAETNTRKRLERLYADQGPQMALSKDKQTTFLAWCLEVAKNRVEAIVGNQHRGSYDKAAVLVGACAEVLRLRGENKAADVLLAEVRERFPRHRAFQAELDAATQRARRSR
jgi:hypothetical protein